MPGWRIRIRRRTTRMPTRQRLFPPLRKPDRRWAPHSMSFTRRYRDGRRLSLATQRLSSTKKTACGYSTIFGRRRSALCLMQRWRSALPTCVLLLTGLCCAEPGTVCSQGVSSSTPPPPGRSIVDGSPLLAWPRTCRARRSLRDVRELHPRPSRIGSTHATPMRASRLALHALPHANAKQSDCAFEQIANASRTTPQRQRDRRSTTRTQPKSAHDATKLATASPVAPCAAELS